jgi:hypothetical protein
LNASLRTRAIANAANTGNKKNVGGSENAMPADGSHSSEGEARFQEQLFTGYTTSSAYGKGVRA